MFKIGDTVVHKHDICKITKLEKDYRLDEDYYTLIPINDSTLVIHTPVSNKLKLIRNVISKEAAKSLIKSADSINTIEFVDIRALENQYAALFNSGNHEDLVKIIKTTYLRKQEKLENGKKMNEKDKNYFNLAEKILYTELSFALGKTYAETKECFKNTATELAK